MQKRRMKLGEILVRHGAIGLEKMHEALCKQRNTGKRVGEVMVELGMISRPQLDAALEEQRWRNSN